MGRWILVLLIGLTLNLIVQTQQDVVGQEPGSGDDGSSDDGEDEEGSADEAEVDLTPCQRQAARKVPGAFSPKCTQGGDFEPLQCYTKSRECWCVGKDGKEKPGTRQSLPNRPKCKGGDEFVAPPRKPPGSLPGDRTDTPPLSYTISDGDDVIFDEASTPKLEKATDRRTSKIQPTSSVFNDYGHSDDNVDIHKPNMFSFIFKDPLILAGIIGGAVLALLCIVLLIMFTIYRMRKKDEGSYALDEPKKSYGFAYTRARDQEFFA